MIEQIQKLTACFSDPIEIRMSIEDMVKLNDEIKTEGGSVKVDEETSSTGWSYQVVTNFKVPVKFGVLVKMKVN